MFPRKTVVQDKLYEKFGVIVDRVIQGKGTSNTGNVSRRCFDSPEELAAVLELNVQLVKDIALMLKVFKCKQNLTIAAVKQFGNNIHARYIELYPWTRMKPTVHKFLKHGADIASVFPLPIANYSEDAVERMHKKHRKNIIQHARQNSHLNRLLDMVKRSLYESDPIFVMLNFSGVKSTPITDDMRPYLILTQTVSLLDNSYIY